MQKSKYKIPKLCKSLYFQVIIAIVIAILLGHFKPDLAVEMKPFGDAFIKLIKMMIGPIIFCVVVTGIANSHGAEITGKIWLKLIVYFEILTTLALVIGIAAAHLIKPGVGMNIDPGTIDASTLDSYKNAKASSHGIAEFFLNLIPTNFVDAFAQGEVLPILFAAVLFGFALLKTKSKTGAIISALDQLLAVLFKIIGFIMYLAPLGAFGAMAFTVGKFGIGSIATLGYLMLTFYVVCILFVFVVLGGVLALCRINIWKLLCYIKREILIVLGTCSSETVLPNIMQKLEKLGCEKSVVGIAIPSGYSFNLDGTCIYFTLAIIFIAQATNTQLTLWQELYVILILLLTSKGATGVVGSAFIILASTLAVVKIIPFEGLVLLIGIDRFMAEARSITNLIGNTVATIVIAKWEGKLDMKKMAEELKGN